MASVSNATGRSVSGPMERTLLGRLFRVKVQSIGSGPRTASLQPVPSGVGGNTKRVKEMTAADVQHDNLPNPTPDRPESAVRTRLQALLWFPSREQ